MSNRYEYDGCHSVIVAPRDVMLLERCAEGGVRDRGMLTVVCVGKVGYVGQRSSASSNSRSARNNAS